MCLYDLFWVLNPRPWCCLCIALPVKKTRFNYLRKLWVSTWLYGDHHAGLQRLWTGELRCVMNVHSQVVTNVMGAKLPSSLEKRPKLQFKHLIDATLLKSNQNVKLMQCCTSPDSKRIARQHSMSLTDQHFSLVSHGHLWQYARGSGHENEPDPGQRSYDKR